MAAQVRGSERHPQDFESGAPVEPGSRQVFCQAPDALSLMSVRFAVAVHQIADFEHAHFLPFDHGLEFTNPFDDYVLRLPLLYAPPKLLPPTRTVVGCFRPLSTSSPTSVRLTSTSTSRTRPSRWPETRTAGRSRRAGVWQTWGSSRRRSSMDLNARQDEGCSRDCVSRELSVAC